MSPLPPRAENPAMPTAPPRTRSEALARLGNPTTSRGRMRRMLVAAMMVRQGVSVSKAAEIAEVDAVELRRITGGETRR